MPGFSLTPLGTFPPPTPDDFPVGIQWQDDGTNLGDRTVDTVNLRRGLVASRGTAETANVLTVDANVFTWSDVTADYDLLEADLREAYLREADLSGAPVIEDIHTKVYAAATARPDLFDMSTFATGSGHSCGTAQCRAGWVLAIAGKEGLDLEAKIGTPAAAMAIYMASDPERWKTERLPDFYTDNATALADMARMAGVSP